jgi:gamma-glutamylcyclotransferase (GGCT)/AIG2-like uncharacterized protein YtfP
MLPPRVPLSKRKRRFVVADEQKKEPETFLLLVYGTLMRDGCRGHVMKKEKFLGEVITKPEYALVDCGSYPGIVCDKNGRAIKGELWEVRKELMPTLDQIEGVAYGLYRMQAVNVEGHDGPIYAYFYQRRGDNSRMFEGDRWDNSR